MIPRIGTAKTELLPKAPALPGGDRTFIDSAAFERSCFGAIGTSESSDGSFVPLRFTEKQLSFYRRSESERIRSLASAGVSLYCTCDAQRFLLEYAVDPGSSQDLYGFDLYVDGKLVYHMQSAISQQPRGRIDVPLPEGSKVLRLFFPNLAITNLSDIELCGATVLEPISAERWLLLGDSIVQGYTTHFPSMTLANLLSQYLRVDLLNQGMAGEVFNADMLDGDIPFAPARILVAYGTNDWALRSRSEFTREAERFLHRLRTLYPQTPIALISPIWRADADTPKDSSFPFDRVHDILRTLASSEENIRFISGAHLMPPVKELYFDRCVHPSELGFAVYAKNLLNTIKP